MAHSCTIQRHHALETGWPGLLLQVAFCDTVKPRGCISWPVWPLRSINKTALSVKLILTADLVYHSGCASLGHLLMAHHCHLCLNVCFSPLYSSQPTQPPSYPPTHPLQTQYALLQPSKKLPQKPGAFKWLVELPTYEILAILE